MKKVLIAMTLPMLLGTGCSQEPASKPYTGRFKVDASTVYVALETPSSIGGACSGWSTVEIRKTGQASGGMRDVICWKIGRAHV